MADNEDDSGSNRTITVAEPPGFTGAPCRQPGENLSAAVAEQSSQPEEGSQVVSGTGASQLGETLPAGSGAHLVDLLQSGPDEHNIVVGADFTSLGPDLGNTTIIYVQPDGSLVEGSGLTAEEQQALLDQLTKQQIVQVSDTEAAQLLQQSPLVKTIPVHNTALDPSQLQQVINQVTKSQQQVHVQAHSQIPKQQVQVPQQGVKQQKSVQIPQQNLKTNNQNNASQQLKSVAQQFAMQTGSSVQVVQKKVSQILVCLCGLLWTHLVLVLFVCLLSCSYTSTKFLLAVVPSLRVRTSQGVTG